MTSLRKLERDYIEANISEVSALLDRVGDRDVMSRFGLEDQLSELKEALARLEAMPPETLASAALFFGGRPVLGSQGIESGFAGSAVGQFQDLVSMVHAHDTVGLAERGTVPRRSSSTLHITNIVRGSFGFLLEEVQPQLQIVDSSLKTAVDEATRLLMAFGEDDEEDFRSAVEEIDQRVLAASGEFFDLMRKSGATVRLVSGETDRSFGSDVVARAVERARTTTVVDGDDVVRGQLAGVLPESHQFEFRAADERGTIRGRVDRGLTPHQLGLFNKEYVNTNSRAKFKVKRVLRNQSVVREKYTLTGIEPDAE
ncbi:hypothetical protein GPL21_06875 [Bradyrhizobium pachyrhizi]|uniref:Uncharacterized protein n=1 Tax=Bradyrhizobium pachyrhizi TaxID=280333 RepID=A0A844SQW8_9BRAD|nr:hypothetical protein [Bradyrhizobium pachyrhizi]MVT64830.1 hypothetical protein [Bradyrhizobium pachyrhizi]